MMTTLVAAAAAAASGYPWELYQAGAGSVDSNSRTRSGLNGRVSPLSGESFVLPAWLPGHSDVGN
jgi:hypothetical protein